MTAEDDIVMETIFGDGSQQSQQGGSGRRASVCRQAAAHRRVAVRDCVRQPVVEARVKVAFAAPYPGKIIPVHLAQLSGRSSRRRTRFSPRRRAVDLDRVPEAPGRRPVRRRGFHHGAPHRRRLGLSHAGGTIEQRELAWGETLRVDTAASSRSAARSTTTSRWCAGEVVDLRQQGLFFATLKGLGHVWLVVLPLSRLPAGSSPRRRAWRAQGEGSIPRLARNPLDGSE
jgi:uncharacterized protein (AIM24 family)